MESHPRRTAAEPVRHDPPLQQKLVLLLSLGCAAGFGLGVYAEHFGAWFWHMAGLVVLTLLGLCWIGLHWVSSPYRQLADQAERVSRTGLTTALRGLPVDRRDEIGRIARSLHRMGVAASRSHMEAQSLRRTLDQRVVQATRRATTELCRLAMRDALTDLGNRRFLDDQFEKVFNSAKTSGTDLACIMMDMNQFKQVNDTLGHEAGDHLLVFLAGLIRATSRQEDLAVRLGGDEFLLVMPGGNRARAEQVAQLVRKLFVRQACTMFPSARMLGVSYGIATLADDAPDSPTELMRLADKRLYQMKGALAPNG